MPDIRHWSLKDQVCRLNQSLRGHCAYYGLVGNWRSLHRRYDFVERYWHKIIAVGVGQLTWEEVFYRLIGLSPIQRPAIYLTYGEMQAHVVQ
jgi:RNA-directed DNA polymerase